VSQQGQQGIAGLEAPAKLGDCGGSMPRLIPLKQHRTTGQIQTPRAELNTQGVIGATITDLQIGQPTHQLAAQSEMAAERAATVVHEHQRHCAILAINAASL
jgi:hypothetical protein